MQNAVDRILRLVIGGSDHQKNFEKIVNQCVGSRNLQVLFLKASSDVKNSFKKYFESMTASSAVQLNTFGIGLKELIERYYLTDM